MGGEAVTGSTFANNSSTATELSFNITAAVAGDTVSVYMDGGATPLVTGTVTSTTVAAGHATSFTLTTDGTTKIANGNHTFTVQQCDARVALYAAWIAGSSGLTPGAQFSIPASCSIARLRRAPR